MNSQEEIFEENRLKSLKRYDILDTPADGNFDRITKLAAKIFNMPIALITLVDHDRIWFKSNFGIEGVNEIGRDPGLCASAILSEDLYLVENAIEDPRTLENPLVCGEFGLRFYAAVQLRNKDGYNLGNLCIIDKKQRYISSEQEAILRELAGIVMDEMELRLATRMHHFEIEQKMNALKDEIESLRNKLAG